MASPRAGTVRSTADMRKLDKTDRITRTNYFYPFSTGTRVPYLSPYHISKSAPSPRNIDAPETPHTQTEFVLNENLNSIFQRLPRYINPRVKSPLSVHFGRVSSSISAAGRSGHTGHTDRRAPHSLGYRRALLRMKTLDATCMGLHA